MTRDEFEQEYASNNGLSIDDLHHDFNLYAVPCNCGEPECRGWRMGYLDSLLASLLAGDPGSENIPDDWDGADLLDALIADGRTELVAALRAWMKDESSNQPISPMQCSLIRSVFRWEPQILEPTEENVRMMCELFIVTMPHWEIVIDPRTGAAVQNPRAMQGILDYILEHVK